MFGEDAELYERARPGYSASLVDDVLAYLGRGGPGARGVRSLEVGAGTGKATVAFAERGVRVRALEPDPAMAAIAERKCAGFPGVRIERTSLEDWVLERRAFDLVFSGQAWHWVRPEVRLPRAAAALVPGGCVALFWHRMQWAEDDPVRDALGECYRRLAPALHAAHGGFPSLTPRKLEEDAYRELAASAAFGGVVVHQHPWQAELDAAQFVELLASQSEHRLLPDAERDRLLTGVRRTVVDLGGSITLTWSTSLVLGRRADE